MKAVICGYILGVVGSRASEGASGLGVAKTVDVCVKKNLVRTHVIALQDGCKSVVGLVEAKVVPVGTVRSSRCRKGSDEGCLCGWMNASEGMNSSAKDWTCLLVVVAYRRVAVVGKRKCTGGARSREPDDLVLHLVERECVAIVNVGEKLFERLLEAPSGVNGFVRIKSRLRKEPTCYLRYGS